MAIRHSTNHTMYLLSSPSVYLSLSSSIRCPLGWDTIIVISGQLAGNLDYRITVVLPRHISVPRDQTCVRQVLNPVDPRSLPFELLDFMSPSCSLPPTPWITHTNPPRKLGFLTGTKPESTPALIALSNQRWSH